MATITQYTINDFIVKSLIHCSTYQKSGLLGLKNESVKNRTKKKFLSMSFEITGPVLFNVQNAGIDFNCNGSPSATLPTAWAQYSVKNFMTWDAGQMLYHQGGAADPNQQGQSSLAVLPPTPSAIANANAILVLTQLVNGNYVPRWSSLPFGPSTSNIDTLSVTGAATGATNPNLLAVSNNVYNVNAVTPIFETWTNLAPFAVSAASDVSSLFNFSFDDTTGTIFNVSSNLFVDATLTVTWNAQSNSHLGHRAIRFFNSTTNGEIGSLYQRANPSTQDTFTLNLNRQFAIYTSENIICQVAADAINVNVFMPLTHLDIHSVKLL